MSLKESFNKIFTLRRLFLWGNVVLLVLFVAALVKDQDRGWKQYQDEFKRREIKRINKQLEAASSDDDKKRLEAELSVAKKSGQEIRQIWSENLNVVDRCITCHVGYDPLNNSSLTTTYTDQPFSAPAASAAFDIHKAHDLSQYGCVICHGGQGTATEVKAAHGEVIHWEKPLLRGDLIQASCLKCHDNVEDLKWPPAEETYASAVVRGKQLVQEHGCLGCHQVAGEGGPISVDFKEETAAKPLSRIDFSYTGLPHEEWTLANWIKVHLVKDPVTLVPGDPHAQFNTEPIAPSAMPAYYLSDKDADAITAYILGLNRSNIPPQYLTLRPKQPEPEAKDPVARGRWIYEKYGCSACHGPEGKGGIRNYNYLYDVTPNLRRAVGVYTREELKNKINEGVPIVAKLDPKGPQPPLYMPAWKTKIKGEELEDLVTYLFSIKEKE